MTNKLMISPHISFPRKEMVYHFTVYPEGKKFLPSLPRSYYLSIKKPNTKLKLSKHSTASKGHLYFKHLFYLVHY